MLSVKEPKIDDFVVRNLYMKILICYTELFKNCGQYFKANKMMGEAQRVVRENKEIGIRHVENECDFIMTLISITTIKGKYSQTIPLHEELLTLLRRKYGKSAHPKLATALTNYGALKLLMCNYVEASTLIEEGLVVRLMFFRAEHPAVASSLFFKATHFMKVGKYQPAYTEMMESLEYRSKVLGNDHPSVAQSLTGLAMISTLIGNGLKAVDGLVKALSIEKQSFGTEMHRQIAGTVFNLGNNAESRGNYVEAERFYLKASELRENLVPLYGGEMGFNLDVEVTKVYLAHIYSLQSRMDEAKTMLKDPIKIIRRILGNNNTIVAQCFLYLGDFCSLRGDYQDAVTLYSLSFDTFSKLLGDRHPSIADVMLQSSNNFRLIGRFKESFELISACLRIRIEVFGEQSLKVAEGYHGQGRIYRDKGKYRDAEKFYLKALNIYISKRVESGAQYACALADSAECYRLLGRYDVAEQSFSKAIAMLNLCYGENSLVLNEALCNFAILLMDMKHFKHSAKILKGKVIPLFKAALGETHPWFLYATANYTFCNDSMNKYQNSTVSLSSSHSVDSDLGDQSIGESVRIPLDKHSEIIKLLDFFHSSTYSEEHPWVARFLDIFNMNHSSAASDTDERSLESSKYDSLDDSYDSSSVRRDLNSVDGDDDYSYSSYTRDSRTELSRMDSGIESQYNDDDSRRSPAGLSHRENSLSSAISDYISVGDESSVDSWEQTKDTYSIDYLTNSQSGSIISKSVNTYQYTPTSASSETDDYYDFTPSTDRKSYISTDSYSRDMKSQSSYTSSPPYSYSTGSRTPIDGNSLSTYDNSNADSPYRSVSSYQQSSSFIDDNREGGSSVDSRDSRSGTSYDPSLDNSADHTYSSVDKSSYKSGNSNSRYSLESSTIRSSHYKAGAKSVSSADRDESVPFVSSRTSAVENDTDNRSYSSNHDVSGTVRNSSFESSSLVESSDLDHSSSKGYLDKSKSLVEPSSSTLDPKTATGSIYLESSGQDDGSTYDSYVDDDRSYESHSHDPRSHADSRSYADESVDRSYNDDSQTVDSHTYDRSKKDHGRSSYREDSQTTLDESSKTKGKSDVPTKAPTEDEDDDYEEDYEEDYEDEDFDSVSNER